MCGVTSIDVHELLAEQFLRAREAVAQQAPLRKRRIRLSNRKRSRQRKLKPRGGEREPAKP